MDRNYDFIIFNSKYRYILRRPRVANFNDIIKIVTRFIKTTFKDSSKVKSIRNSASKYNLCMYFLIKQKMLISGEKMLMSVELKECVTWFIYFWDLLYVIYNCAKFQYCRISVADFKEGSLFCTPLPPPSVTAPKRPILNKVKRRYLATTCAEQREAKRNF